MGKDRKGKGSKLDQEKLTRKEWLLKTGKYAAFTAAAMMTILDPVKAQDKSTMDFPRA